MGMNFIYWRAYTPDTNVDAIRGSSSGSHCHSSIWKTVHDSIQSRLRRTRWKNRIYYHQAYSHISAKVLRHRLEHITNFVELKFDWVSANVAANWIKYIFFAKIRIIFSYRMPCDLANVFNSPRLCILVSSALVVAITIRRECDVLVAAPVSPVDSRFWKLSK